MEGNTNEKESLVKRKSRIVFLVWDRQSIRAYGISKHIGASLHFLHTSRIKLPMLFIKSLQILRKERPRIIICQSPPIACAFIAMVHKYLFAWTPRPKILIDVHTGAIMKPWSKNVSRLFMKLASFNIVTNMELQNYVVQNYGIKPLILEDPIPDFSEISSTLRTEFGYKIIQKGIFNVAVISSFAYDEPLQALFEAASKLPDIQFYITGDKTSIEKKFLNEKLHNVIFTGFLDYNIYLDLLQKVDVIMDLTTDDKTMLSGAYEAVALEQPLITSDWIPLRRYFNKGTIYVNNSPKEIIESIMLAMKKKEELSRHMHQLKIEKVKEWREKISKYNYLFTTA
jgi:glycosyltransferase involved in cell wall biosynthesis